MSRADETLLDLALSRATVDRSARERADDATVARALADPTTRVLVVRDGRTRLLGGDRAALDLRPPCPGDADRTPWFLGRHDDVAYLAVDETEASDGSSTGGPRDGSVGWVSLREVGADLDDTEAGLLTTATALHGWHRTHRHCPRCGTVTEVVQGGWVRRCPADGSEHHPRTDPAIIVAVVDDDDRLLLATGASWPEGRISVLAGFVEAGESMEAAVVREVHEEVGLDVADLVFRGDQPWPFPASLMLAFRARALTTDLVPDPTEIRSAAWYARGELADLVRAGARTLPSRVSIARVLIEEWFGGPLPEPSPQGIR
ncbi:NAD(+) diphosphatase [Ornithinimicrobium humiphilum]|uniref:NAD(+) diphosphatase n=1 Tax=Ornithinimicrobium humiphilum TaxID=125288 RepID=UPI00192D54A8|nr:NAD(+) diphosphatase [Ornithinimicrobium humiphilum]